MKADLEDLRDLIVDNATLALLDDDSQPKVEIEEKDDTVKFPCHEKVNCILTLNKVTETKEYYSEIRFIYEGDIEIYKSPKTTKEPIEAKRIYLGVKNIIDTCKELWENELKYC